MQSEIWQEGIGVALRTIPVSRRRWSFAALLLCTPIPVADAQSNSVMILNGHALAVSPFEVSALSDLGLLVKGNQRGLQDQALERARSVAISRDGRYVFALYELEIGQRRRDDALRAQALDVLIPSRETAAEKLPNMLGARGDIAFRAGDLGLAQRMWSRWAELAPDDPDVPASLAQLKLARGDAPAAMALLDRAISMRRAVGLAPPPSWYRQRLSIAYQVRMVTPGIDAARALVAAYPTPENWRAALDVYRQLVRPEGMLEIDVLRLMRYNRVLIRANEYLRTAQLLLQAGTPLEAMSVLDEGGDLHLLEPGLSPNREIIAAVQRAIDQDEVVRPVATAAEPSLPDRSGEAVRAAAASLAAGRRKDAEAAFRAVALDRDSGRYGDLAFFWLETMKR